MYCNKHNVATINYDEKGRDITNRVERVEAYAQSIL